MMPETRFRDVYQDGVLISHEPYEVPDSELAMEARDRKLRSTCNRLCVSKVLSDSEAVLHCVLHQIGYGDAGCCKA